MTIPLSGRLVLVGAGKMGSALLDGWLAGGLAGERVAVLDPQPPDEVARVAADNGIAVNPQLDSIGASDVLVLAVKPQAMDAATEPLARIVAPGALVLSIAAGRTIASFEALFGAEAAVVRAMPNTPAAIGRGITVACGNTVVSGAQRELTTALLKAAGEVAWIDDEALIDAVTAVSGGGPAYVFLLTECLAEAGVEAGLPDDLAMRLARVTVSGAGELMRRSPLEAATLRENVTSPGGTTAEALKILRGEGGLRELMIRAIAAAAARSRELAQ